MARQDYATHAGRIEKMKGRMLAHAQPVEALSRLGRQIRMPKNNSRNYVMRRWLPYDTSATSYKTQSQFFDTTSSVDRVAAKVTAHQLTEGVKPSVDSITPVDITATLVQYGCLYSFSDLTADLYEDNVPEEMVVNCAERTTLVNEMIVFGTLKGCANQFYAGGVSLSTVNKTIGDTILQSVAQAIQAYHGREVNSMLAATKEFGTTAVSSGYFAYCHTDLEPALRAIPGFTPKERYAEAGMKAMTNEIGCFQRFRFVTSPDLVPWLNKGAAVGTTGMRSQGAANIDVYHMIVLGRDAFCQVAVRGMAAIETSFISAKEKSKPDPLGQVGYVGAKWLKAVAIENDAWMACINLAIPALAA
jgi:N4-gp56 family major capsid protein